MKRRVAGILMFAGLILGAACSSGPKYKEEPVWVGKNKHDLIQAWGLPTRTDPDGNGGEILTYDLSKDTKIPVGDKPKTYKHIRQFFVDAIGKIYHHRREEGAQ